MIRVIFYLILVAALAFGAVWMADRPGEVAITWQGTRIDTSVLVLIAAVAAVVVAAVIVWSILRAIVRAPETIARYRRYRRGVRGYLAVSQGLIAVGSGDARAAKRFTADAVRIAPREPLTLLLSAQSAQLSGDHERAVATFQEMASRDDTRVLGLHGLFVEAQRRADHAAALTYAEEAARHASVPVWAAQAVLEFRCVAGDWSGALDRLDRNLKSRLIDRRTYRRQRLSRVEALAAKGPADAEAALAVAQAALDAKEFAVARTALAPYTGAPRRRVAALMAELEMAQGDEGRAREWMARALNARRDPAWTADAFVSDHWLPISPVSGRLDAFEWKDPLAGEDHGTVIEHRAEPSVPAVPARVETPQAGPAPQAEPSEQAPHALPANEERERAQRADEEKSRPDRFAASGEEEQTPRAGEEDSRSPFFAGGRRERRVRAAAMANESRAPRADMTPVVPGVIPLVHAPDDPGPNGEPPAEPEPPPPASWSRIRALFKS